MFNIDSASFAIIQFAIINLQQKQMIKTKTNAENLGPLGPWGSEGSCPLCLVGKPSLLAGRTLRLGARDLGRENCEVVSS